MIQRKQFAANNAKYSEIVFVRPNNNKTCELQSVPSS